MTLSKNKHKNLFPIVDAMIDSAVEDIEDKITCFKGCSHCCHLLVEVSWEEAEMLVEFIKTQAKEKQVEYISKNKEAAVYAREIFSKRRTSHVFMKPTKEEFSIPEAVYDDYFDSENRPCPFLANEGICSAYEYRPTSCRLHMVTSDPKFCSRESFESDDFCVPDRIDELKEEAAPVICSVEFDGRWGQMAIMVEAVLKQNGML